MGQARGQLLHSLPSAAFSKVSHKILALPVSKEAKSSKDSSLKGFFSTPALFLWAFVPASASPCGGHRRGSCCTPGRREPLGPPHRQRPWYRPMLPEERRGRMRSLGWGLLPKPFTSVWPNWCHRKSQLSQEKYSGGKLNPSEWETRLHTPDAQPG